MSKILVKKVKPCDLSTTMIFILNHLHKVIHVFDVSEDSPDIFYDRERLIYHLGRLAENEGRRTAKNMVGYSTKYAFLFGYLMGNGTIDHKEGVTV